MKVTRGQVIETLRDEYEADILIAMADTFGFELKQGKSKLYAYCKNCGRRFYYDHYGQGSMSERIAMHGARHK